MQQKQKCEVPLALSYPEVEQIVSACPYFPLSLLFSHVRKKDIHSQTLACFGDKMTEGLLKTIITLMLLNQTNQQSKICLVVGIELINNSQSTLKTI